MSGNPLNFLISPLLAVTGLMNKPKAPKVPLTPPPAQVREPTAVLETVSQRRGSRTNQRTGTGGAEATGGSKTKLGA